MVCISWGYRWVQRTIENQYNFRSFCHRKLVEHLNESPWFYLSKYMGEVSYYFGPSFLPSRMNCKYLIPLNFRAPLIFAHGALIIFRLPCHETSCQSQRSSWPDQHLRKPPQILSLFCHDNSSATLWNQKAMFLRYFGTISMPSSGNLKKWLFDFKTWNKKCTYSELPSSYNL